MDIEVIYTRDFSKIEGIQNGERVYYNLLFQNEEEENMVYGIELVSSINGKMENQIFDGISASRETTLNILKFLYENSVRPYEFIGIVSDLISSKI